MRTMMLTVATLAVAAGATTAVAQRGPQGPVTRDAYLAAQKERFAEMDADKDGAVIKAEMTAQLTARMGEAPPADRVDMMFAMLDTNADGKATAAEAEAAAAARFTVLDTDKDGTLTPEERRAGMPRMMGR